MMSTVPTSNHPNYRKLTPTALPIYSFDWSPHSAHFCSLAVGSFITQRPVDGAFNQVQLATLSDPQVTDFQLSSCPSIMLEYPVTKVQYSPHRVLNGDFELFGVSGDGLKIYKNSLDGCVGTSLELVAKLVPAQISTSPTASATASRRPSDANIITSNPVGSAVTTSRNSPAPITSFDWNRVDPNLLVTSSYDTTCAVWNLDVRLVAFLSFW